MVVVALEIESRFGYFQRERESIESVFVDASTWSISSASGDNDEYLELSLLLHWRDF